jgi:transposase-like protein
MMASPWRSCRAATEDEKRRFSEWMLSVGFTIKQTAQTLAVTEHQVRKWKKKMPE